VPRTDVADCQFRFFPWLFITRGLLQFAEVSNKQWPDVLNFGRIVRNAFAHGGTLEIRDGTSVRWGGLRYSKSQNGRRVLYNDLSSADLTILMLEMDALF
jgi:hypothetical protein